MLQREAKESASRELLRVTPDEFDRLEDDIDQYDIDAQTPINISRAHRLIHASTRYVSFYEVVGAAFRSPDLLVIRSRDITIIGLAHNVFDSNIVIEDDCGDEEYFPVCTVDPDSATALPMVGMSAEGLKHFVEEQDGMWMVIPDDGVTIDYQIYVRNGRLRLTGGIAELERPVDEDPDMSGLSATRRMFLSEAIARSLNVDQIETGVTAC